MTHPSNPEPPVAKWSHDHLVRLGYSAMILNLSDLIHNKRILSSPLEKGHKLTVAFLVWRRKILFLTSGTNVPFATPDKEEF